MATTLKNQCMAFPCNLRNTRSASISHRLHGRMRIIHRQLLAYSLAPHDRTRDRENAGRLAYLGIRAKHQRGRIWGIPVANVVVKRLQQHVLPPHFHSIELDTERRR